MTNQVGGLSAAEAGFGAAGVHSPPAPFPSDPVGKI
jgi:hypothetical protein